MRRVAVWSLLGCSLLSRLAFAEEAPSKAAPAKAAASKAPSKAAEPSEPVAGDLRRDPKGVQGVSPMWEAIGKGDSAVLARDYDAAIAAYREAITKSPQSALPHYRMGEAQVLKGDLKEARAAYDSALRFVGSDDQLKGKVIFCLADLAERQKAWDEAIARWSEYETFAKTYEKAKSYPASAAERKKRISEWKQLSSDSAAVKERIEKRLKEVDEAARKAPITK